MEQTHILTVGRACFVSHNAGVPGIQRKLTMRDHTVVQLANSGRFMACNNLELGHQDNLLTA